MIARQLFIIAALLVSILPRALSAEDARAKQGMVATVNSLATDAGVAALRKGGNAVDAAIAAALTLGVVDSHNSGIGGGCFALIRQADGNLIAIDGREIAPAKAHRDMYLRDGKPQPELSKTGALASGVPGALAAYELALSKGGRLKLHDLLLPAAEIAEKGFPIDRVFASRLSANAKKLARFEASRAIFLKPDGSPYKQGETLKQPDLASTYRAVAEHGIEWFYRGKFAKDTQRWMESNGGMLTAKDFASYRALERNPIVSTYHEFEVVGFPSPSSGGIHVAQILNILEQFRLKEIYQDDPAKFMHLVAEAMKPAFADRAYWLGDADFAKVPRGLTDKKYAKQLSDRIDLQQSTKVKGHGQPARAMTDVFNRHTTHIAAADDMGNWVAITATINTSYGSKVVIPGTGVVMNNQMDDFSIAPGVPNAFGLIGAEANAIEPGKRPLSSMSPTIVLRDGQPVLTVGAAGGPRIISQVVLAIVNHLSLGMPIEKAVGATRIHHQWSPDTLFVESSISGDLANGLKQKGHKIERLAYMGVTQAIAKDGKFFVGVHDPRVSGKAAGY
jgi:gamma-glutamyltranspeptidase/glutathione hydrolase